MKERLEYVDIAKGIALVLVLGSHSDALDLMWLMMDMCIPIFFFCSGYTYSMKGTFWELTKKKFWKLFIPYLFFNFVMLCVFRHFSIRELVGILYSRYSLYPLDVVPNLKFFTSGNYPMWYLTGMIVSCFLFHILLYQEKYRNAIIVIYAMLTVGFLASPILLPWSIDTAPLTALVMYAGMQTRKMNLITMNVWQVIFLILLYIGLRLVCGDLNISVRMYGSSVAIYFLLAVLAPFIVLWCSTYLQGTLVGKLFMTLGKHSLTIFCVEIAFIVWAKDIYKYMFPGCEVNYLTGFFEIIMALLGGWLISVLIHKSKFLSRIAYGT